MASATTSSEKKSKEAASRSKLFSSFQKLYGKDFSWEQMCFITHNANFSHDFEALRQSFNMQFNTNRTLDSIDVFLRKCDDDAFFNLSQEADNYPKWYTEHPIKPGHPPILLGSRMMRTELRAYLAYHHHRGMDFSDLRNSFNLTFPTEARNSRQLTAQLNYLTKRNQLFNSLCNFSARYSWHPKYEETITPASTARKPAASHGIAKARLRQVKQKTETLKDSAPAKAAQMHLLRRRVGSGGKSVVAERGPAGQSSETGEGSLAAERGPASKNTDTTSNIALGLGVSIHPTIGAITGRPRHAIRACEERKPGNAESRTFQEGAEEKLLRWGTGWTTRMF